MASQKVAVVVGIERNIECLNDRDFLLVDIFLFRAREIIGKGSRDQFAP